MKKDNGFTLVELMITLVVAGILATIGVPGFQYLVQSNRMSTQTNDLVTALSTARTEAVRRNQEVTLEPIDNDWEVGFRVMADGSPDPLRTFTTSEAVSINQAPGEVRYLGNGSRGFDEDAVTFQLRPNNDCLGDMERTITISPGGSVRTERGQC